MPPLYRAALAAKVTCALVLCIAASAMATKLLAWVVLAVLGSVAPLPFVLGGVVIVLASAQYRHATERPEPSTESVRGQP